MRSTRRAVDVDGDALGRHHREALVHRADRVAARRRGAEGVARVDADVERAVAHRHRRRARRWGSAPCTARRRRRRARRAPRAPRRSPRRGASCPTRGPTTSTTLDVETGMQRAGSRRTSASRLGEPGVQPSRTDPVPSARSPRASGGRFSPRSTTASRVQRARTASPRADASTAASSATAEARLAPKSPALPAGEAGTSPGAHQLASGSRYAGSTQVVCSMRSKSPSGSATGCESATVELRPWRTPDARARRAASSPRRRSPTRPSRARRARPPARCRRRTERGPRTTPGPATWAAPALERRPRRGGAPGRAARGSGAPHRAPSAASTMGWKPVQRQRCAASAVRTDALVDHRPAPQRGEPHDDARRAEPALGRRRSRRTRRRAPSRTSASRPVERRHVASRDPRDGRHARHPRLAVDEHRAAPALALGRAAVLHVVTAEVVAQRLEEGAAAR